MISFAYQHGLDADALLGPESLVAEQWLDFESRPEQLAMARRVQAAMQEGFHLTVEAGTGVGKSFAYLSGAIDQAVRQSGKVLISTHTINLQQQLIEKDIPFLASLLPERFTARLAKGRGHYLCKRRLEYAVKRKASLFDEDTRELGRIAEWAEATTDGSVSELDFVPASEIWQAVQSEHGNCQGRKCGHYSQCFYWKARRKLETADIIVANHALLFSDLALKEAGVSVLPDYHRVIIDEAHTIEHIAEDHFGIRISQSQLTWLLDRLYNPRKRKGLLAFHKSASEAKDAVKKCRQAAQVFFAQVQAWYAHAGEDNNGRCEPEFVENNVGPMLKELRLDLVKLAKTAKSEDDTFEFLRYADQLGGIETDLKDFILQQKDGCVYWIEVESNRRKKILLRCAPLDVGPYLKRALFDQYESVVLTSATLSLGGQEKEGFAFFSGRVGLEDFQSLQLGSPFDYEQQVQMYLEPDLPEPNSSNFVDAACEAIKKYLLKSDGRAFVLFTSYAMLKKAAANLEAWMADQDMELLVQGGGTDRARLLEHFKQDTRSVLFGTDSFWQGVDVPGESLSNVIIVKLPFAVPNHPLIAGRIELLKEQGHNPFFSYQLPMAIIKFKQGFGRLIRNKTDRGMVVVLDSRIVRKMYGRQFIAAIPKCRVEVVNTEEHFE
ncbi:MAG: helicase C-terminal domain-containing protein [Planctomycetota bacterium]